MTPTDQAGIEALGWIVTVALVTVIAAIVLLIRSGRTVPPSPRQHSRPLHRTPPAARDDPPADRDPPRGHAGRAHQPVT